MLRTIRKSPIITLFFVLTLMGCGSDDGSKGDIDQSSFMGGKYRLSHQIPPSTVDPDERLIKDDIANRLTAANERQFWAQQNFRDNVIRKTREIYLQSWEGDLLEALNKLEDIERVLDEFNLNGLGPPNYWLATPIMVYNMSGQFRVGVEFKKETPEFSSTKNRVTSALPNLVHVAKFEPVVQLASDQARQLANFRSLPADFVYLTRKDYGSLRIREVKAINGQCLNANGLSKGFAEYVATRMRVSIASVSLIRASDDGLGGCSITIDTARGPQSCMGATLYTDGKNYWVGGICY